MLPVVTSDIRETLQDVIDNPNNEDWKREMIHHLKEDNPEVNSILLNLAQGSSDAKRVILAGYLIYKALEMAEEYETASLS